MIILAITEGASGQDIKLILPVDIMARAASALDSANIGLDTIPQRTTSAVRSLATRADSVKSITRAQVDSTRERLQVKIDSLTHLGLPTDRVSKMLDSLASYNPDQRIANLTNTVDEKRDKLLQPLTGAKPLTGAETTINEKLNQMRVEGGDGATLPANLRNPTGRVSERSIPELPSGGLPTTDLSKLRSPVSLDAVSLPKTPDLAQNLPEIQGQLPDITQSISKLGESSSKITSLSNEGMSSLADVPGVIEKQVAQTDQLQAVQKEIATGQEALVLPGELASPEQLKQAATKKVYAAAINHFAGKEKVLNDVISQLNSLKAKYPNVTTIKDNMPKKMKNEMHGRPLIERILPGIELQIQRAAVTLVDYNPNVAYRFTGRLLAGAGWNERIAVDKFKPSLNTRIFGPRIFTEFKVFKGFSARFDIEKMNTLVPPPPGATIPDFESRAWIWSAFVGIKKEYQFIKGLKGNFQFMYNLYDDHDNSPYAQRLSVRFGFELHNKKKKSKSAVAGAQDAAAK